MEDAQRKVFLPQPFQHRLLMWSISPLAPSYGPGTSWELSLTSSNPTIASVGWWRVQEKNTEDWPELYTKLSFLSWHRCCLSYFSHLTTFSPWRAGRAGRAGKGLWAPHPGFLLKPLLQELFLRENGRGWTSFGRASGVGHSPGGAPEGHPDTLLGTLSKWLFFLFLFFAECENSKLE